MIEPAIRSRLLQLRRDHEAARTGRDLLDRKREAILAALAERVPVQRRLRVQAAAALAEARAAVAAMQIAVGRLAVDAATLAQPPLSPLGVVEARMVGVAIPQFALEPAAFQPRYGPAGGGVVLDRAGAAMAAALPLVIALASAEEAVRCLRAALARTARRVNALDKRVIPELAGQIRSIEAALEEDERDEAVRTRSRLAATKS